VIRDFAVGPGHLAAPLLLAAVVAIPCSAVASSTSTAFRSPAVNELRTRCGASALLIAIAPCAHDSKVPGRTPADELEALSDARREVQKKPKSAKALFSLAVALIRLGDNDGALECLERSVQLDSFDAQAWYLKGLMDARKNMWVPACQDFRQSVKASPTFAEARMELGDMLRRTGDFEGAAKELKRATELKPEAPLAIYDLGLVQLSLGNIAEAKKNIQRVMKLQPAFPEAQQSLGDILLLEHDWAGAAAAYKQALAERPDSLQSANGLAVALIHLGDRSLAAAAFEKAHQLARQKIQQQRAEIANAKALNLWQAGDTDGALAAFNQALSDDPEFAEAHYNLGRLLWKQGKANEATAQYKSALDYRPRYPEALNELGEAYLALGQTDQAVRQFRTAIMARFAFVPAHFNLGRALNKQGQRDEAEEQFQETILLAPQKAAAHIELGLAFAQADGALSPRARAELAEGLRLDPSLRGLIPEQLAGQLP